MPNNHFKKGNSTALLQGSFDRYRQKAAEKIQCLGMNLTIEQWSVLYHLWKQDGISQQELCNATFRDKPSITGWLIILKN
jgi:DNA-binding MarR family transcriptional regulator